ncbi:MAG: hypothetical protein JSU87_02170 [Gemmatimonadota bacterium]|nr:MAG: hypothetical protein JSU87_02170 [Gemmatimonadota bacterium]
MNVMKTSNLCTSAAAVVLVLTLLACSGSRQEEQTEDLPEITDQRAPEAQPAAAQTEASETGDTIVPETTDQVADAPPGERPAVVAPAPGLEQPAMRNWMLIEFADSVTEADLSWLERSGFRVGTLIGPTLVRGWLEVAAGGEAIARDPRVARIHAQMR